jgi:SWI/SNF-related matrix-associated actin-dependent regulator 1 of chromatin subfamily A
MAYQSEWPLVIYCPSFVKYHWRYEVLKWLPSINLRAIQIVQNERELIRDSSSVVIVTYEAAFKQIGRLEQFKVSIVDEAESICKVNTNYNLDNMPAPAKKFIAMLGLSRRVIVLSTANGLEKPVYFYPFFKIIRPDITPSFMEFGYRYCDPR